MAWYERLIIPAATKSGTETYLICDISISRLAWCSFPSLQKPLRNHCSYVSTKALSHAIAMSVQELFSGEISFNSPVLRQKNVANYAPLSMNSALLWLRHSKACDYSFHC